MKTVQEWLNVVDEDALIDTYINEFNVIKYESHPNESMETVRSSCVNEFREYLRRTKTKKVIDRRDEWVFFATPHPELDYIDIPFIDLKLNVKLCYLQSILNTGEPEFDSWVSTPPEEVFGCAIAETEYTINNMYKVLALIIWDNTFFGYEDDSNAHHMEELEESSEDESMILTLEELIEMLDEAANDLEDGSTSYFDLPVPVLRYGNSYQAPKDVAKSYEEKMRTLATDYATCLLNAEISKLRNTLDGTTMAF